MRRILKLTVGMLLAVAGSAFFAGHAIAASEAQSHMPGNACAAVNLTQALRGIRWDQFRITNQSDGPLFITCPVNTAALGAADADGDGEVVAGGYVDVYFPGTADDVQCIWRQQSYAITAGSQAIFEVQTAVSSDTGPNVHDIWFEHVEADGWMNGTADSRYQTVTCATQPGTGINAIEYYASDVSPP